MKNKKQTTLEETTNTERPGAMMNGKTKMQGIS
jgi:hypothetical protein